MIVLYRYAASGVQHALKSMSFDGGVERFYSADTSNETMYSDDHHRQHRVTTATAKEAEHIYEEIPDLAARLQVYYFLF